MSNNEKYLRLDPVARNLTAPQGTDKFGLFLMSLDDALAGTYDAVTGTGWRREGAGDGLTYYTTTLDEDIWTANGGLGYYTGGTSGSLWSGIQGVARSVTNASAWARYSEWVNGQRTGREWQWQRTTTSATEAGLTAGFATAGFTGTPNATTPLTTSTTAKLWFGLSAWGTTTNWCSTTVASNYQVGGSGSLGFQIWTAPPGVSYNGCVQFAFMGYGVANDLGFFGGYWALRDAAAVDDHPFFAGASTHANFAGTDNTYTNSSTFLSSIPTHQHATDAAGTTWYAASAFLFRDTQGTVFPPANATTLGRPNADGHYTMMPLVLVLRHAVNTSGAMPKGVVNDMVMLIPAETTHTFGNQATDDAGDLWMQIGYLALPWPSGVSLTNWSGATTTSTFKRYGRPGVVDDVAPVVGTIYPAAGAIAYDQAITVTLTDTVALAGVWVTADYSEPDRHDVVARGDVLSPTVDVDYSVTPSGTENSVVLVVSRTAGWLGPFTLRVYAMDAAGNLSLQSTTAYTISTSPNPAAPDTSPPAVSGFSPAPGAIAYDDSVSFTTSDDSAFRYVVVVRYADYPDEIAYNGYTSSSNYSASVWPSSGSATVTRTGGWLQNFTLVVTAYDEAGNLLAETAAAYTISGENPNTPDTSPPTLTVVSPTSGKLGRRTPVVLRLQDAGDLALYALLVRNAADSSYPAETVYLSSMPRMKTLYTVTREVLDDESGYDHTIVRNAGWSFPPRFEIAAVDVDGNLLT